MAAQVRAILSNTLNTDPLVVGAANPTREALINQGLDDITTMHTTTESDVDVIIRGAANPLIPDPNWAPGVVVPVQPWVRDRGLPIPASTQLNIKKLVHYSGYLLNVQRVWNNPTLVMLNTVYEVKLQCTVCCSR